MKHEKNYCWIDLNLYKLTFIVLNIFLLGFESAPCKENYVYPKMHTITFNNGIVLIEKNPNLLCPDKKIESFPHKPNFINNNIYQLTITAGFKMAYIWIYNEIGIDTLEHKWYYIYYRLTIRQSPSIDWFYTLNPSTLHHYIRLCSTYFAKGNKTIHCRCFLYHQISIFKRKWGYVENKFNWTLLL